MEIEMIAAETRRPLWVNSKGPWIINWARNSPSFAYPAGNYSEYHFKSGCFILSEKDRHLQKQWRPERLGWHRKHDYKI